MRPHASIWRVSRYMCQSRYFELVVVGVCEEISLDFNGSGIKLIVASLGLISEVGLKAFELGVGGGEVCVGEDVALACVCDTKE